MSSWRKTFETIIQELELSKMKKQTLDELLDKNRMSKPTYEHLASNILAGLRELENLKSSLSRKMETRASELRRQIDYMKLFIANMEIQNIGGLLKEDKYNSHKRIYSLGLEASENELATIEESLRKIKSETSIS